MYAPQPMQPQRPQATDGKAIAALVLGILSMIGCLALTGIPALVLGIMARRSIAQSNGARGGDGMALGGIIMGGMSLLLSVFVGIILIPLTMGASRGYHQAQQAAVRSEMLTLQTAALSWQIDHGTCPTPQQLKTDGALASSSSLADPWGTPFTIDCTAGTLTVTSAGPDKKLGTADDLRVP